MLLLRSLEETKLTDPHHDRIRYWETEAGVYDDEEEDDNGQD